MQSSPETKPLSYYPEAILSRCQTLNTYFPELWEVASSVHQGFEVALKTPWPADKACSLAGGLRWRLGHLAHLDWIYSFTLMTSGQRSMATMLSRRAVEYLAHAAKLDSDARATLYMHKSSSPKKLEQFKTTFDIPRGFRNETKYGFLWNLLGFSDASSDWGAHNGWETVGLKHLEGGRVGYFDDPRFAVGSAYVGSQLGIWLLEAFEKTMETERPSNEAWSQQYDRISSLMLKARDSYLHKEPLRSQLGPLLAEDPEEYGFEKFKESLARADREAEA